MGKSIKLLCLFTPLILFFMAPSICKAAPEGHWELVDVKSGEGKNHKDRCGEQRVTISEGTFSLRIVYFAGVCNCRKEEIFSASASWTPPPKRLKPGEIQPFTISAKRGSNIPGLFLGLGLSISIDLPRCICGSVCGGRHELGRVEAHSKAKSDTATKTVKFKVPAGSKGESFAIRFCPDGSLHSVQPGFRYIYEWNIDSGAGVSDLSEPGTISPKKGIDFNDLSDQKLRQFESCVCRCSLGMAPEDGGMLSLKKVRTFNANAPCAKLYNGPCIGGAAVCSRGYPKDSCIKKCMEEDGLDNYAAAKAHFDEWSRKARLLDPKYLEAEKEAEKRVQELKSIYGKPSGAWISFGIGKMEIVSHDGKTISGNKIHYGDTIKTFDDSEVVIVNKNGSEVIMGPNSTLVFLPPRKKRKLIDIKLILGKIWIDIKKTNKKFDESFDKMNTDLFILLDRLEAWAKGTKFRCIEKGNVSVIEVYEGTVEVTSKATSEKMILNPGQGVTANKEGMSLFKLSDSDLNMSAKEREAKKTAPPNLSKSSERNSVEPEKTNIPTNRSDDREWQSLGQKSNGAKENQTLPSVRDEGIPKGHTTKYGF